MDDDEGQLDNDELKDLLKALLQVTARTAFPEERLRALVFGRKGGPLQLAAYNLCDGSRSQKEIAEEAGLDPSSLNRTSDRWLESGILFRIGPGREARLLHLYPLRPEQ